LRIEVQAHSDNSGDAAYNQYLSEERANSVRDYLIAKGIAPDRIEAKGYGESQPIADNDTREGRAANRRVELKVIE
jgi:outer membrane protein OmpA-like peptidoglycan-associated protein